MGTETTPATTGDTADPAETEGKAPTEAVEDASALKKALEKERAARREADKRVKALEPFEKQAKDAAEASKTETQKLADLLEGERRKASSAEMELVRYRTASEKNVPINLVRFLTGDNADEIAESADLLIKELGGKPGSKATPGRPTERLSNGTPSDAGGSDDPMELIKQARAGRI